MHPPRRHTDWEADSKASDFGRTAVDVDRTTAELDQTAAEIDQTASDSDQSSSDRDRIAAELDQTASDRDQRAADAEFARLADPSPGQREAYERSQSQRDQSTLDRHMTAVVRGQTSAERLREAGVRDEDSAVRDALAHRRDRFAERTEGEPDLADPTATRANVQASGARSREAGDRVQAASDRRLAAVGRTAAAHDREHSRAQSEAARVDDLTGAYRRVPGAVVLRQEVERASHLGTALVLAFVGIRGRGEGRAAGDAVLSDAVAALGSAVRPVDPIVRWEAAEFVCTISGQSVNDVERRLGVARESLRKTHPNASISSGLASLREGDTLDVLLERAGGALHRTPHAE